MGGKPGFGAIIREQNEPTFHQRWEAIVFCLQIAATRAGAIKNVDQFRHSIERIQPQAYLNHGYYGRWLGGIETLLRESGTLTRQEIEKAVEELGGDNTDLVAARPTRTPDLVGYLPAEGRNQRLLDWPGKFVSGTRVKTRAEDVSWHCRLPAYARGRTGVVVRCHGGWVFPDSNAHGKGEAPQHLYTIQFSAEQLWGSQEKVKVHLDLFEDYLEAICE